MLNQWWDQLVDLFNKNPGGIAAAIAGAFVGALLTKFGPWLWSQIKWLVKALVALAGGNWQDFQFERV